MKNENELENKNKQNSKSSSIKKKPNNWNENEDKLLIEKAQENNYRNWSKVASFIKGRSAIQCSARYKRIQPGLVKGAWTPEEDEKLVQLAKNFGKNWCSIAKYMPTRTGKQIRDRFLNALDPNLNKNKFTEEEDQKIIELYKVYGKSWCLIAKNMSGRTGDMVKNRFYSSLKKHIHVESEPCNEFLGKKRKKCKKMISNVNTKSNSNSNSHSPAKLSHNILPKKDSSKIKKSLKSIKSKTSIRKGKCNETPNKFPEQKRSIPTLSSFNNNIMPNCPPSIGPINGVSLSKDCEFGAQILNGEQQTQAMNQVPSLSLKFKNELGKDSFLCDNRNFSSIIHNVFNNPFSARPQPTVQGIQFNHNNNPIINSTSNNVKIINDNIKRLTQTEQNKFDNLKTLIDDQAISGFKKDNLTNQLKILKEIKGIIREKQGFFNKN